MNLLVWFLFFIPALLVELFCYLTNPIAALFTYREPRLDVVKRLGKRKEVLPRDYLYMSLWNTHDNAADEWWYGVYNEDHWFDFAKNWTQHDYDNNWFIRYYCRLMWIYRNTGYGFHYALFSKPKEEPYKTIAFGKEDESFWFELKLRNKSFQFECQIPLLVIPRYISINVGWKAHKETAKLLYANRFIGFRKY
jgi:hypothetical protein